MPSLDVGPNNIAPFGKRECLASTKGLKPVSRTFSATVAAAEMTEQIDGVDQIVLQPGTILARITSGADQGKVGPYNPSATDGREVAANIEGVNKTFLPWQLMRHDTLVAVWVDGRFLFDQCDFYTGTTQTPLDNATVTAIAGLEHINVIFEK